MLAQLLFPKTKKKTKAFTHLTLDLPVFHEHYMKFNKKRVGSCIPHKDIEEIYGQTENLRTNVLYGRTGRFLFIARGEEMIEHILKNGSVPMLRHPAILIHYPLSSEGLLKKRVE